MNKPFSVTARIWKNVPLEKGSLIHSLSALLNEQLRLSQYGDGVVEYNFTAIIEPSDFFPAKHRYLKSEKRIDVETKMDYDQVIKVDMETFKSLVAQQYLETIDRLEKQKIENFDFGQLRRDVEDLFARQGWVVSV